MKLSNSFASLNPHSLQDFQGICCPLLPSGQFPLDFWCLLKCGKFLYFYCNSIRNWGHFVLNLQQGDALCHPKLYLLREGEIPCSRLQWLPEEGTQQGCSWVVGVLEEMGATAVALRWRSFATADWHLPAVLFLKWKAEELQGWITSDCACVWLSISRPSLPCL